MHEQEREPSPEASPLADVRRGLKPFQAVLPTCVRQTTGVHEGMRRVNTPGVSVASRQACQERLGDFPARSPIRQEVSHSLPHYRPVVESTASPLLGSREVIASLLGKATQRVEAHGRSALHTSILLRPCMGGARTQDLVAEALPTVRVHDVTTWVSETIGDTMQSIRRRARSRPRPQPSATKTAALFADTG